MTGCRSAHLVPSCTGDLDTKNTVAIMDLLLAINQVLSKPQGVFFFVDRLRNSPLAVPDQDKGLTCIMVTHNPDLECYADRVLYVEDGCVSVCACVGTAAPLPAPY